MRHKLGAVVLVVFAMLGCGRVEFEDRLDAGHEGGGVDADAGGVDAPALAGNFVFVTSTTHLPTSLGADLSGADAICAERAASAGLTGTYRAWLSSTTINARDRISGARGWIRVDGRPVVDRVEDLVAGRMFYPIRIDERGEDVGTVGPAVATGTAPAGTAAETCGDYGDPSAILRTGTAWGSVREWTAERLERACATPARLYCFGVDRVEVVAPVSVQGRRAFVSAQPFAVGGGIAAADDHCNSEAELAGLSGTYLALLATTTSSASARFDLMGAPWVRVDGIPLAPTPLALMSNGMEATLSLDPLGTPRDVPVHTGAERPVDASSRTCSDWTSTEGSGHIGSSGTTSARFFFARPGQPCDARSIYCLEQ